MGLRNIAFIQVLAVIFLATSHTDAFPPRLRQLTAKHDELFGNVQRAADAVQSGFFGMGTNVETFVKKVIEESVKDLKEFQPHVVELLRAIPAKDLQKFAVDVLVTLKRQTDDHCSYVMKKYNPLHPDTEWRTKRSTDVMTLTKFGNLVSALLGDVDTMVQHLVGAMLPAMCAQSSNDLEQYIVMVSSMQPEEFKKRFTP